MPLPEMTIPLSEMALRLGMATLLGGALGLNRELRRKPAGLRTLALVGLTSAVISTGVATLPGAGADDAARVAQGILAGIGFLGGGVILRRRDVEGVTGLTTAASIWVVAALGFISGLGEWQLAAVATAMALVVLVAGDYVERKYLDSSGDD